MKFNKTIQMCIFGGNPNGMIMCELSNWNGRVYKISRNDLGEFAHRSDSEYTGVYFLFGRDEENNDTVYILGDMFWCNWKDALPVLDKLHGRKILIKGNHESLIEECCERGYWQSHDVSNGTFDNRQLMITNNL